MEELLLKGNKEFQELEPNHKILWDIFNSCYVSSGNKGAKSPKDPETMRLGMVEVQKILSAAVELADHAKAKLGIMRGADKLPLWDHISNTDTLVPSTVKKEFSRWVQIIDTQEPSHFLEVFMESFKIAKEVITILYGEVPEMKDSVVEIGDTDQGAIEVSIKYELASCNLILRPDDSLSSPYFYCYMRSFRLGMSGWAHNIHSLLIWIKQWFVEAGKYTKADADKLIEESLATLKENNGKT